MNYTIQIYRVLIMLFISLTVIFSINYIVDPYSINRKFNLYKYKDWKGMLHRARIVKFRRLNEIKPNAIMLGGSRVQFLNARDYAKYINGNVYNMSLPAATIHEQLKIFKYSITNFDIENIVIGISYYTFLSFVNDGWYCETFPNGMLEKKARATIEIFCDNYLSKSALEDSFKTVVGKNQFQFIDDMGSITPGLQNFMINRMSTEKRYKQSLNGWKHLLYGKTTISEKKIQMFKEMIEICKEQNINYKVFISPIHNSQYKLLCDIHGDNMHKWKVKIANITDFTDFSVESDITKNEENYVEGSHAKQKVGKLIFAKLYGDLTVDVPNDFGKLITRGSYKVMANIGNFPKTICSQ